MAILRIALSHTRRHYIKHQSFQSFNRFLSSSSESNPNNPSSEAPKQSTPPPISLQPISYPVKPKNPSNEPQIRRHESNNPESVEIGSSGIVKNATPSISPVSYPSRVANPPENVETGSENAGPIWTREDMRYVKNAMPSITPVSYPSRVANLPEDRGQKEGEVVKGSEEIEKERKVIEKDRLLKRVLKEKDVERVPFPTLIKVEQNKPKEVLDLVDAIKEVKANAKKKFDETIEAHVRLGIDRRRTDQQVSGTMTLPHGIGKVVKVAVFAEGASAEEAKAAGADVVGGSELVEGIMNGTIKIDFDKCITTPVFMPRLGKIAKILGKRGLMPNPKRGTIVSDVSGAIKEAKQGRVDFKMDKTAIVHVGLGKVSFPEENLRENIGSFVNALLLAKPVGLKKTSKYAGYVNSFHLCSTMGPGFAVSIQSLSRAADHFNKVQLK